jgi:hypothetical protein
MPDDRVHDVLYSEAALALGEIHWMILKATQTMDGERWNTTKLGFGKTYQDTDFGKEVGMDENHWWIFKKEPDVDELGARTEEALTAGQTLQISAVKLKRQEPKTYKELLLMLKDFADHRAEIETLHGYTARRGFGLVLSQRPLTGGRIPLFDRSHSCVPASSKNRASNRDSGDDGWDHPAGGNDSHLPRSALPKRRRQWHIAWSGLGAFAGRVLFVFP